MYIGGIVDHHYLNFYFTLDVLFIGLLFVFSDLLTNVDVYKTFQHDRLNGFIQLTVDVPRNQLIVGSR